MLKTGPSKVMSWLDVGGFISFNPFVLAKLSFWQTVGDGALLGAVPYEVGSVFYVLAGVTLEKQQRNFATKVYSATAYKTVIK